MTDPRSAAYEIANYLQAVEQLTVSTLRNVVGSMQHFMPPHGRRRDDRQPSRGPVHRAGTRHWSTHTPPPAGPTTEPPEYPFFPAFQHAPRGVDVQDLRPLRGRPCGPILDPDAYPGAPNTRTKKVKTRNTG